LLAGQLYKEIEPGLSCSNICSNVTTGGQHFRPLAPRTTTSKNEDDEKVHELPDKAMNGLLLARALMQAAAMEQEKVFGI
jgi:hypothetical protein